MSDSDAYPFVAHAMAGRFVGPTSHGTLDTELLLTARADNTTIYVSPAPDGSAGRSFNLAKVGDTVSLRGWAELTGVTIQSNHVVAGTGTFFANNAPNNSYDNRRLDYLRDAYAFASDNAETSRDVAIPLVISNLTTATGEGDTDLLVQNAHDELQVVHITATRSDGSTASTCITLAPGQAVHVPATDVVGHGADWYGSAQVSGEDGPVLAVANVYTDTGGNVASLQSYRGFDESMTASRWVIPLMASRLSNGFNTPITVQNRSGRDIPAGRIALSCTPAATSAHRESFTVTNDTAVRAEASYFFNPVVGGPFLFHENFFGTCEVSATVDGATPASVSVMPQARTVGGSFGDAGSYQAYPADNSSRATTLVIPWNTDSPGSVYQDKSAVTIVNLTDRTLDNVEACYQPGNLCKTFSLGPQGQEIENGHVASSAPDGIDGVGLASNRAYVLELHSPDGPIGAFNQIKRYGDTKAGDSFVAYNAATIRDETRTVSTPSVKMTQHIEGFDVQTLCDQQMAPAGWLCDNSPGGLLVKTSLNGLYSSSNPTPPDDVSRSAWTDWVASKEYRGYAHIPSFELTCSSSGVHSHTMPDGEFSYGYTRGPGGAWFADPDVYVGPEDGVPAEWFNDYWAETSDDGQCVTLRSRRASRIAHAERVVVWQSLGYDQPYVWHNLHVTACCDGSVDVSATHSQFPDARLYIDDQHVGTNAGEKLGEFMKVAGTAWNDEGWGPLADGSSQRFDW